MATLLEQAASLFGFEFRRAKEEKEPPSFAPKQTDDGASVVTATGGFYGSYIDLEGTVRTEAELVSRYRDMSLHPEVDSAIEDITSEAIVTEDGEKTVQIMLDDIPGISERLKAVIQQEFEEILRLFEFNTKSYDVFRRWYIDGRLYYHALVDPQKMNEGIQELRFLDPRRIRKVRETTKVKDPKYPHIELQKTVQEYYVYADKDLVTGNKSLITQVGTSGYKIAKDSIVHCTSGMTDTNNKMVLGYLHKAIRPLNSLRALEDAAIIYRISRAPERRVFYIDVGNLPKIKAEQYIRDMMVKHKNKLVYDSTTGEIRDDRKFMTMLEDYWLPRREGGRGTQIDTLQSGHNLGVMEDVEYFQKKLYRSLNVPLNRLESDSMYSFGRSMEVTRDEIKFSKFIDRLRLKFSALFLKTLEKQLVLKGYMSPDDWENIQAEIKFKFLQDNRYAEIKEQEMLLARMNVLTLMMPFIGKYYSNTWVRKNLLQQGEEEMDEIDTEIVDEMDNPQYAPPIDMMAGMGMDMGGGMQSQNGANQKPKQNGSAQNGKTKPKTLHEEDFLNGVDLDDPLSNLDKLLNTQLKETLIHALKPDEENPS
jgi:hypothetical protein